MSLATALNTAQSIFSNTATQMAVTSKNVANVNNADYSRRSSDTVTSLNGASLALTARASDATLMRHALESLAAESGQTTLDNGLTELQGTMGGNDYSTSPSTYLSKLQSSLQTYAASPSNTTLAASVISSAKDLSNSLNSASSATQTLRSEADTAISTQVSKLNDLLSEFKTANDTVKGGTAASKDVNDALDRRDALLKQISSIIGVQTVTRDNNDMAIYTSDGTTLFETTPRDVTFQPQSIYSASTTGNAVYVDGVALTSGSAANTTARGSLQANLQLRDDVAPTYQKQLDEIARGLVTTFAETDQTGSSGNTLPGLFTWSGGTVPAANTLVNGLAASISVNTAVDPDKGGNATLLRDGGINGSNYVSNTTGAEGYSTLLDSFVTGLSASTTFDSTTQLGSTQSLMDFSSSSIGWFEEYRSASSTAKDTKDATSTTATQALSNSVGVSLDEELSKLLDLEQSYKASAKLVSTVDEMMQSLLQAAG